MGMPSRTGLPRFAAALATALSLSVLAGCSEDATTTGASPNDSGSQGATTSQEGAAGDGGAAAEEGVSEELFPDIVSVDVTREGDESASFAVTVSSPYDSPDRYADGWRVLDQDGTVLGEHTLGHDHATEQPFTRTQSNVKIPEGTTELTVEGRDQVSGYGGETVTVEW